MQVEQKNVSGLHWEYMIQQSFLLYPSMGGISNDSDTLRNASLILHTASVVTELGET